MGTHAARRPHLRSTVGRVLSVLAVGLAGLVVGAAPAAHAAGQTIVSLTFDDSQSSQYGTLPVLKSHGMVGTFYVESGDVGTGSYYMTWPQIADVAAGGNEIGGHTLHHPDLTTLSTADATTAVCDDRTNLVNHGYNPKSFAYPYASYNTSVEQIVQSCGYQSARTVGGVTYKESIPPPNPYVLRTPAPADASTGLAGLKASVTGAQNSGGGWVIIVFHGVCDNGCTGSSAITNADFAGFLDFLQSQQGNGVVVRTVGDVMTNGSTPQAQPPATTISCNGGACSSTAYPSAVTVSLAATDPNGDATTTYYTTDGSDPTTSSTRTTYSGAFQVAQTRTVRYYSTDATGQSEAPKSQTINVATSTAAPPTTTITCNNAACSSSAYTSAVTVRLAATDPNGDATTTYYTTDGSDPTTSATRTTYSAAFQVSQTSTVRFYSRDATGQSESPKSQLITVSTPVSPPTTTISCNGGVCSSTAYPSAVSVTLSATDPQGSATTTYYTTDGSDPTTSSTRTTYAGAFSVATTRTVRYYSRDALGASETPKQQLITVGAGAAPTTTISCNGTTCSTGWYRTAPVTVRLAATDPNGDATTTYFTTDGSDPTSSSTRKTYAGAFSVGQTTSVRFYSTDATGRTEAVKQQQVRVDAAAPSVTITSPASGSSFRRSSTITLSATATDTGTGSGAASGVSRVVFYLDGSAIGTVTTPLSGTTTYRYSWYARASTGWHTLTAVAYDAAGNTRTSAGVSLRLRW
jgi:peptidoglycan/xylan/chitin deacetylase (PgdA/CDA1 family)